MSDHSDLRPWLIGDLPTEALGSMPNLLLRFLRLGPPWIPQMIECQIRA